MGRCAHRPCSPWFVHKQVRLTKPPQIAELDAVGRPPHPRHAFRLRPHPRPLAIGAGFVRLAAGRACLRPAGARRGRPAVPSGRLTKPLQIPDLRGLRASARRAAAKAVDKKASIFLDFRPSANGGPRRGKSTRLRPGVLQGVFRAGGPLDKNIGKFPTFLSMTFLLIDKRTRCAVRRAARAALPTRRAVCRASAQAARAVRPARLARHAPVRGRAAARTRRPGALAASSGPRAHPKRRARGGGAPPSRADGKVAFWAAPTGKIGHFSTFAGGVPFGANTEPQVGGPLVFGALSLPRRVTNESYVSQPIRGRKFWKSARFCQDRPRFPHPRQRDAGAGRGAAVRCAATRRPQAVPAGACHTCAARRHRRAAYRHAHLQSHAALPHIALPRASRLARVARGSAWRENPRIVARISTYGAIS